MVELTPVMRKFVLHWGEMGSTWGLNRTVAQIYAILYLSSNPMTAEEISKTLSVARSTVSTGLKELQGWGVIRVVHVLGDRRDHFEVMNDVWEMFRVILNERKRREVDPALEMLHESVSEVRDDKTNDPYVVDRLQELLDLFEIFTTVYDQVEQMPTETLKKMAKLGDNFARVLNRVAQG